MAAVMNSFAWAMASRIPFPAARLAAIADAKIHPVPCVCFVS
jgi:hypothetical protein